MRNRFATLFALLAIALMAVTGCGGNMSHAPNARYVSQKYSPSVAQITMDLDESVKMVLLKASLDDTLSETERKAALIDTLMAAGGSGFAVREVDDEVWFITNRHVATAFDKPTVSLDREISNKKADIIYVSDRNDLAVISIKAADVPLLKLGGLVYEGEHVLSLGYPSVRGVGQVYQAAEGVVSNKCFAEDKDNGSCLIQHTATIDHGNSGGPLVDAQTGRVVGVNTWGFQRGGMSTAYVSIPADHVAKVLEQAAEVREKGQDKAWRQQQLLSTVREFLDERLSAEPNEWHLSYMVSSKLLVRTGMDNYRLLKRYDKVQLARKYGLMAVMAFATEKRIGEDINQACEEETERVRVNATDVRFGTHDKARVIVRCGKARREMQWTYEYGRWQIVDYYSKPLEKENKAIADATNADQLIASMAKELAEHELGCLRGDKDECDEALFSKGLLMQEKGIRAFVALSAKCKAEKDEKACEQAAEAVRSIVVKAYDYVRAEKTKAQAQADAAAKAKADADAAAKAKAEEQAKTDAKAKARAEARAKAEQEKLEAEARAKVAAEAACEAEAEANGVETDCSKAEPPKPEPPKANPPKEEPKEATPAAPPPGCNSSPCAGEDK
jgi:S1-C subfamily serine protease